MASTAFTSTTRRQVVGGASGFRMRSACKVPIDQSDQVRRGLYTDCAFGLKPPRHHHFSMEARVTTATRRLRRVSIAGLATIATVGGLVATTSGVANAAFAAAGGSFTYQASTVAAGTAPDIATNGATVDPTLLYPGKNTQAGAPLSFALPNTFSGGDQLTFTVQNNGTIANTAQNCSAANNVVGLAAAPTVTLGVNPNLTTTANPSTAANGTTAGSTTDTAPTFTVALGTSSSCVAQAGVHDEFTVTFTDHSTGTASDYYNFQITGLSYNVTAQATPGQVSLDVLAGSANTGGGAFALSTVYPNVDAGTSTSYPPTSAGTLPRTPTANSAIIDAYVSPLQFAIAAPDTIQPDGTKQTIGNITLTETLPGQLNSGGETPDNYTLTFAAGVTVDTLSPAPTVTIAGNLASTEAVTLGAVTANSVSFSVVGGTATSGPATITISGVRLSSTSAVAVAATLNGGILNANGNPTKIYTPAATRTGTAASGAYPLPLAPVGLPATISVNSNTFQIGGTDRYATAAKLFQATVGTCSIAAGANRNAVLVDGTNYPDALSANYLAGALNTGILLTDPSFLPGATLGALRAEGVTTVYVVGGTAAVSAGIVTELAATPQYNCDGTVVNSGATAAKLNVIRIAGADRYATGQLVDQFTADLSSATSQFTSASDLLSYTFGTASLHTAFVASGANYPDALAAGPAVYQGYPLVLTDPNSLTASSAATLTSLGIQQVIILGGTSAVSAAVATQLAALNSIGTTNVIRFAGTDRTDTARLVAEFELTLAPASSSGTGGLGSGDVLSGVGYGGFPSNFLVNGVYAAHGITVYLANGGNYPDALAGGPLAGVSGSPLVLTASATTAGTGAPAFVAWVATLDGASNTAATGNVEDVTALGLSSAVSPSVLAAVATAASGS
jgi:putative cell wall-binding protein